MALINNIFPAKRIVGIDNLPQPGVYRVIGRNYLIHREDRVSDAQFAIKNPYSNLPFPDWYRTSNRLSLRLNSVVAIDPKGVQTAIYSDLEDWSKMEFEYLCSCIDVVIPGTK